MKIKRIYMLLAILTLTIAAIQGCGNKKNTEQVAKNTENEAEKESTEEVKKETKESEESETRKETQEDEMDENTVLSYEEAADKLEFAVPGYKVGEIPPIPQPLIPELGIIERPDAKVSVSAVDEISSVPGITVTPVKIENGIIVNGRADVMTGGSGAGQFSDEEKNVQSDGDGGGQYREGDIFIQTDGSGGGQYVDSARGITLQTDGNGSGIYSDDIKGIDLMVDNNGGGQYSDDKKHISIMLDGNGGGTYSDDEVRIVNGGDGSGSYTNDKLNLSIRNDGKGTAIIEKGEKTLQVEAEPLEAAKGLPKLEPVPPVPSIEANGILITLDSGVLFDVDKYNIRPDADETLKKLAEILKKAEISEFQIDGHTDSEDTDEHNQILSENRANSVKDFLVNQGVEANITTSGYGEKQPVASNDTPEGRQLNRRVEIIVPAN